VSHQKFGIPTAARKLHGGGASRGGGGLLAGGRAGPGGEYCVWLEDRGDIVPLIWPYGCEGRLDPPEIIDEAGQVVARVGQEIHVSGMDVNIDATMHYSMGKNRGYSIHHFFPPDRSETASEHPIERFV